MAALGDHETSIIAEVDCTNPDSKMLCERNRVRGFPTLKWGEAGDLKQYMGPRTFKALSFFAENNLTAVCSPANVHLCDEETQVAIANYEALPFEELTLTVEELKKKIEVVDADFARAVQDLKDARKNLEKTKEEGYAAVTASGHGLALAVHRAASRDQDSDDDNDDEDS